MKARLIYVGTYNYSKNGVLKKGRSITVQSHELIDVDDNNGNVKYGYLTENIFVPDSVPVTDAELLNMVGESIEITYTRNIGSRFDRISSITLA